MSDHSKPEKARASQKRRAQTPPTGEMAEHKRTPAEWTALIISGLIVLTVLGLVVYDLVVLGTDLPVIEVRPVYEEIRAANDRFYLPVRLNNSGATTAGSVTVSFTLDPAVGEPESAGFTIRFLAPGERDEGVLIFQSDPSQGVLSHTTSFVLP